MKSIIIKPCATWLFAATPVLHAAPTEDVPIRSTDRLLNPLEIVRHRAHAVGRHRRIDRWQRRPYLARGQPSDVWASDHTHMA